MGYMRECNCYMYFVHIWACLLFHSDTISVRVGGNNLSKATAAGTDRGTSAVLV